MREPGTKDYRDLEPKSGQKRHKDDRGKQQGDIERDWWNKTGPACASSVRSTIDILQKAQQGRMRQATKSARLYGNVSVGGGVGTAYSRLSSAQPVSKDRVTYNAIQEIGDTLVSRVGENKPRPYFLTSGGSYKQQRKAKKLNQFVEGVFYETKTYDIGLDAFRDAMIWGDGFVFAYVCYGRINHERVLPSEIWVDEEEAQYGSPRNMHRVKLVDRDELIGAFPEKKDEILKANRAIDPSKSQQSVSDMVTVAESWHLGVPDGNGKMKGGKHCITLVSGQTMLLEPEDWNMEFFPFARVSWCKRPIGYFSQGLCEQLEADQLELNQVLALIQRSMRMCGSFKVFLQNGSQIVKEHINNEVGSIINYTGQPPVYMVPQPIDQIYIEAVGQLINRMRARSGVSEQSTAGIKPTGLNSGRALREQQDIESDRHRSISRANDNLYLQLAAIDIALANEAPEKLKAVRAPGKNSFAALDWSKDIKKTDADEFVMQCFPVSRLPRDPSGRLQTIQEYIEAGMISPRQGRKALDFADIDSIESLANSQEDMIQKNLDAIIDDGEFTPPEPTDDLQLSKEMVIEYIQRYRQLDIEPEKLDMLRDYNSQIDTMMDLVKAQQAMQQQQMNPQQPPGVPPGEAPAAIPPPTPQGP